MERLFWVALDFPCIATFLYIVPGNIFSLFGRFRFLTPGWMTSGHLVPFLPSLAIGIALALTASLCLQHGLRPDFPTVCFWFIIKCLSNNPHSIIQILSITLVLHLALPEELTLPLVVLLAIVVVLDLQIPLGPLLYFVSPIFDAMYVKSPMKKIIKPLLLLAPTGAHAAPSQLFHINSSCSS